MADRPELDDDPQEVEYGRQCDQAALYIRLGNYAAAESILAGLLERWSDRTTVQELAGDLAAARGQMAKARAAYKKALELEPANADAERKYGLALVSLSPEEQQQQLIQEVVKNPTAHRPSERKPLNAVLASMLFPGLGQLYNREHEKGLLMLAGGAVLLMLSFYMLIQAPFATVVASGRGDMPFHEQVNRTGEALTHMGAGHWFLTVLILVAFSLLYLWGIYDAWKNAQSSMDRILGVG